MFDNLRNQSSNSQPYLAESATAADRSFDTASSRTASRGSLLGMTAAQRLIIAVMLLLAVCALGAMCLLITGRIGII